MLDWRTIAANHKAPSKVDPADPHPNGGGSYAPGPGTWGSGMSLSKLIPKKSDAQMQEDDAFWTNYDATIGKQPIGYTGLPVKDALGDIAKKDAQDAGFIPQDPGSKTQATPDLGLQHYDDYETRQLTDEEWAKLTSGQQRAVLANQLMYEASISGDPEEQKAIYDYLGLSEEQRTNKPENFATMKDIERLGQVNGRPLPDNTPERTAVNDRNAGVLDALRALTGRIKPIDSTQSGLSALDLNTDVPRNLQEAIGRGLSDTDKTNLESNFFKAMIYTPQDTWINTPGMLEGFSNDFSNAIKGLSATDVATLFKQNAEAAKKEDPSIDVNALLKFYGLGG